jgi:hypothetical protein
MERNCREMVSFNLISFNLISFNLISFNLGFNYKMYKNLFYNSNYIKWQ